MKLAALFLLATMPAVAAQPKREATPKPTLCSVQVKDQTVNIDCATVAVIAQLQAQITYLTDSKADKQLDTTRALAPKRDRKGTV